MRSNDPSPQTTVNVADIDANGARISSVSHFTLNEYVNAAETWTPDSNALVFRSVRNGHLRLFKQALDSDTEEPLVMGSGKCRGLRHQSRRLVAVLPAV